MSNEELAVRIQAGEATVYSVLWEQVKGFVCNAAYRFYNHYTERCNAHGVDSSDLVQAGYFALVDCVNAYDPQTGYKLLSFDIVNIGLHFFLKDVRPMLPPVMNHSIAVA